VKQYIVENSTDFLFWLLNGGPIVNTPWILVYVVCVVGIWFCLLYLFAITRRAAFGSTAILTFFPMLFIVLGPPIWQIQMLNECHDVVVSFDTDLVKDVEYTVRECRFKENANDEFGEWRVVNSK
jgi:hypothetical protein